ncbi:MAG: EF-hand domain-containing protein [Gammaproteobacteria bacterium]|nr:EF-hand domain-containing protein [Gammaproteobacteria bacterium]MBU1724280.1 EF-hand domain-containing protein [Gammaproteobacteria bacterium]MBU2006292.1 EF-hand domain-containing protein [Gammaproteobacteria bacterium]
MKTTLLSLVALSAALSAPAFAAGSMLDQQSQAAQALLQYDTNQDGIISRAEMEAGKAAEFAKADANANGFLSWDEFNAWNEAKRIAQINTVFAVMDADGNASVSAAEFANAYPERGATQVTSMFALADTNADGALSQEELTALRAGNGDPLEKQLEMFTTLDTNADKQLSVDEFGGKSGNAKGNRTPPTSKMSGTNTSAFAGRIPGGMRR